MRAFVPAFAAAARWLAAAAALAAFAPRAAHADEIARPSVPDDLVVEDGNKVFLVGHAFGTQNYICLPSATSTTGFAFALFTPEATLLDEEDEQLITHFFGPNPEENGAVRAAWQHSRDGSTVWAKAIHNPSFDRKFVAENSVPWLLLQKVGVQTGTTGGDVLTATTFVQRINTAGGVAPSTGCASSADVGAKAFIPYTADYYFYKKTGTGN
jgi:hypothetical protein